MPKIKTLTLAMSAVSLLAGCTSTQTSVGGNGLKMEAVQKVTHGHRNPQAFYQLGRYYHGQTRYELALEAYGQAVALQPQYVEALTGMGVAHAMLGHYDEALRALKAAASIDPASVTAQNNLGYIYWLLNEREQAMQAYRAALTLDPLNARARDNLRVAMNDAANAPAAPVANAQPAVAPEVAAATPSDSLLQEVAPQVYELRAPSPAAPAGTAPSREQPLVARADSAPAAAAGQTAPAGSGLALNEVAPRVYELRMTAPRAEAVAPSSEHAPLVPASQAVVVADVARPVSPPDLGPAYLEVMNGNGVKGMANSLTRYLAAQGYPTLGAGNQPQFNEARTRIEYRPGHGEAARRLSGLLPGRVVLSEAAEMDGQASIRLVLGKDIRHVPATWNLAGKDNPSAGMPASVNAVNAPPLAVANGNGVKGMARKVAEYLAEHGYRTTNVYDLRPFNKTVTRIEYRKGYASQAIKLGDLLPGKVAYVESAKLRSDVRLVLGHDIKHNMAAWSPWLGGVKLAEAADASRL